MDARFNLIKKRLSLWSQLMLLTYSFHSSHSKQFITKVGFQDVLYEQFNFDGPLDKLQEALTLVDPNQRLPLEIKALCHSYREKILNPSSKWRIVYPALTLDEALKAFAPLNETIKEVYGTYETELAEFTASYDPKSLPTLDADDHAGADPTECKQHANPASLAALNQLHFFVYAVCSQLAAMPSFMKSQSEVNKPVCKLLAAKYSFEEVFLGIQATFIQAGLEQTLLLKTQSLANTLRDQFYQACWLRRHLKMEGILTKIESLKGEFLRLDQEITARFNLLAESYRAATKARVSTARTIETTPTCSPGKLNFHAQTQAVPSEISPHTPKPDLPDHQAMSPMNPEDPVVKTKLNS